MENQIAKPAPVPELNEIVTINERDLLIENYLPSLSNYQKVIKKFKIDLGKDKKKIQTHINYPLMVTILNKRIILFFIMII